MIFSSITFLFLFLPLVLGIYFVLPGIRARNLLLMVASFLFYAWGEKAFALVMVLSITVNYFLGIGLERCRNEKSEKGLLILSVFFNLGLLAVFKYTNFIVDNLNIVLIYFKFQLITIPKIHLPAGISFFTFHSLSYIIDIYRSTSLAQKSFEKLTLYISFFPQLIAGPIIRYHDVEGQLSKRPITSDDLVEGIRRFILGLGKKVLIANTLAEVVDKIFAIPSENLTLGLAWLGIVGYTLQIYFDFSGYSDMAIGLARMFGFHFLENFNYPYISQSIRDFWKRWHISLSNWLRDYLYIPLGGNRCSPLRNYFNLLTVFFLCGLWHGASWNFVIWGLFHGAFLILERLPVMRWLDYAWSSIRHLYAVLVVMIGWVFFRTTNLNSASAFLKAMVGQSQGNGVNYNVLMYLNLEVALVILVGIVASVPIFPWILKLLNSIVLAQSSKWSARVLAFLFLVVGGAYFSFIFVASAARIASGTYNPFIYFRF